MKNVNLLTGSFLSNEAFPGVTWLTIILIVAAVIAAAVIIITAVYYAKKSKKTKTEDATEIGSVDLSAVKASNVEAAPIAPIVATAPVAKPVVEPIAKPVAKSVVAPVEKPVAPVAKPVAPVEKPVAPVAKPVAPVEKPVAKPVVAPVAKPVALVEKPVAKPVVATAPAVAPVASTVAKPAVSAKAADKAPTKSEVKAKTIKIIDEDNNTQSFGKYVLVRNTYNEERPFMFQLLANNGQLLFESEQYKNKPSATIIKSFQKNAIKENFRIDVDKTGKFRYKLFTSTNKLIGVGESCPNKQSCESAIESVIRFAISATIIEDLTAPVK